MQKPKLTPLHFQVIYKSFGKQGELMPETAIRSVNQLAPYFGKDRVRTAAADESVYRKSQEIVAKLNLQDERAIGVLRRPSTTTVAPCAIGTMPTPTPPSPRLSRARVASSRRSSAR